LGEPPTERFARLLLGTFEERQSQPAVQVAPALGQ
jgi:hypothetical protein